MAGLERRLESLEARRKRREARPTREALARLSDEELRALEEALLRPTLSPGEPLPPNELIEKMKTSEERSNT
jgi:DNA-binding GntR family transcriptional regulator